MKKCAVFSCLGLGDGLIALVLSNNLYLNGCEVVTFHPSLSALQTYFPHLPIRPFPENIEGFDEYYIIFEKSPWMEKVIRECPPEKTKILNPIATLKNDYPHWEVGKFQGDRTFSNNLYHFCKNTLKLPHVVDHNGIIAPKVKKNPLRVVIHPTSSKPGKNWPKEKFLSMAEQLKNKGYEPVFIVGPQEKNEWPEASIFNSLAEMAAFVSASGYMIGNDSGIGHLASCFGLPTVTICRSALGGRFWRPGWSKGKILYPPSFIPNLKGMRFRDKYWKKLISVNQVVKAFLELK